MPLGLMNDEEFNKELELYNKKEIKEVIIKEIPTSGRNEGDVNKPESLRKVIAECKINGAADNEIIDVFKTSTSSINAYTNGRNGTNDDRDERLANFVKHVRTKITKRASRKLLTALDSITKDKIDELKANEISVVAKNLSSIINENNQKTSELSNVNAQFIIFTPPQKVIKDYDVIDVGN